MAVTRVTQAMMVDRVLRNLNRQTRGLLTAQDQLATGLRVTTLSDDPISAQRGVNARTTIAKNDQYLNNITSAQLTLSDTESVLDAAGNIAMRAYELTLQAANGTNGDDDIALIAEEVNQLLESIVSNANYESSDRYIFGGTCTGAEPFEVTRDADGMITAVNYVGNAEHLEIAISDNANVAINETGYDAFLSDEDIFATLIGIRDDMLAGDSASLQDVRLTQLDTIQEQLSASLTRVGAVQNRLESATTNIEDFNTQLKEAKSDALDADYAEVVVNYNAQTNAYNAALNVAANVIQMSILDYVG